MKKQKLGNLRKFANQYYPQQLTAQDASTKYKNDEHKPYNIFLNTFDETRTKRESIKPGKAVAHWFMRDLRVRDNNGLSHANKLALKNGIPMLCFWVHCPEMELAHNVGDFQKYYRFLSLHQLQEKLAKLNINLIIVKAERRADIIPQVLQLLQKYGVSHLFSNLEYEVDELRLATTAMTKFLEEKISFTPCHNSCVVLPGALKTKSKGTQYAVFSPWFRAWMAYVDQELFSKEHFEYDSPIKLEKQLSVSQQDLEIPDVDVDKERFHKYWKMIGEDGALEQLAEYIESDEINKYKDERDFLDLESVSNMSVHISSGTISTRTILQELRQNKKMKNLHTLKTSGVFEWIRQISWRDFYKHIICYWPYVCMFKPFHLEYDDLSWEYDEDHFERWCLGNTGFPIVDACMRCLNETGYLNNRGRLIVASFLSKNLLIDWRNGEQYFLSKLIDSDFCSNNGGWGFASSTGVDPQPYFRIFNPWTQSERFDPDGEFIKKWVPELVDVSPKMLHKETSDPLCANYTAPIVSHKETRSRALEKYKAAMEEGRKKNL